MSHYDEFDNEKQDVLQHLSKVISSSWFFIVCGTALPGLVQDGNSQALTSHLFGDPEASLKGALAGRELPGLKRLGRCCDGGARCGLVPCPSSHMSYVSRCSSYVHVMFPFLVSWFLQSSQFSISLGISYQSVQLSWFACVGAFFWDVHSKFRSGGH